MGVFEPISPIKPTPQQGAMRIKRTLAQTFQQIEQSLTLIRQITERHGPDKIAENLGKDRNQVNNLYGALKTLVEKHKPTTKIPDLNN